jgi:HPt (histidine-containing phosphotransfer) domain-containing protein
MEPTVKVPISEALNQLWVKFLPQMEERLAVLEAANRELAAGSLSDEKRLAAAGAAHKLAGVLGTFGLAEGTNLAREAEIAYSSDESCDVKRMTRLEAIARELAAMVRRRR